MDKKIIKKSQSGPAMSVLLGRVAVLSYGPRLLLTNLWILSNISFSSSL